MGKSAQHNDSLEGPVYPTVTGPEVDALRERKDEARSEWLRSQLAITNATRRRLMHDDEALAVMDEHAAAGLTWRRLESQFVAARLGFRREALPLRRGRRAG